MGKVHEIELAFEATATAKFALGIEVVKAPQSPGAPSLPDEIWEIIETLIESDAAGKLLEGLINLIGEGLIGEGMTTEDVQAILSALHITLSPPK